MRQLILLFFIADFTAYSLVLTSSLQIRMLLSVRHFLSVCIFLSYHSVVNKKHSLLCSIVLLCCFYYINTSVHVVGEELLHYFSI